VSRLLLKYQWIPIETEMNGAVLHESVAAKVAGVPFVEITQFGHAASHGRGQRICTVETTRERERDTHVNERTSPCSLLTDARRIDFSPTIVVAFAVSLRNRLKIEDGVITGFLVAIVLRQMSQSLVIRFEHGRDENSNNTNNLRSRSRDTWALYNGNRRWRWQRSTSGCPSTRV
jgi:hypothetical protein